MPAWGVSTVVLLFAAKMIFNPSPAAPAPVLFKHFGLTAEALASTVRQVLGK